MTYGALVRLVRSVAASFCLAEWCCKNSKESGKLCQCLEGLHGRRVPICEATGDHLMRKSTALVIAAAVFAWASAAWPADYLDAPPTGAIDAGKSTAPIRAGEPTETLLGADAQPSLTVMHSTDLVRVTASESNGAEGAPPDAAVPVEIPTREAIDSGRAQPVFLSVVAPDQVRVGDRFVAVVSAETENDVAQIRFTMRFDPTRLRVISVGAGDLMAQAGAQSRFSYVQDAAQGGLVMEVEENAGGPPVAGGGSVASVEFEAVMPGEIDLALERTTMLDLNGERVAYSLPAPNHLSIGPSRRRARANSGGRVSAARRRTRRIWLRAEARPGKRVGAGRRRERVSVRVRI